MSATPDPVYKWSPAFKGTACASGGGCHAPQQLSWHSIECCEPGLRAIGGKRLCKIHLSTGQRFGPSTVRDIPWLAGCARAGGATPTSPLLCHTLIHRERLQRSSGSNASRYAEHRNIGRWFTNYD